MLHLTKEKKQNLLIYLFFVAITIAGLFYGHAISGHYKALRVWQIENVMLMLLGVPFLLIQAQAKLPDFWQGSISSRLRLRIPLLIGALFGILDILVFKVILHPEPYSELPPFLQPFPYSCFLYFSGAFEVEVFYRLIPMTLILLFGNWFLKGRYYDVIFWAAAVLTALREPLEQLPEGSIILLAYSFLTGFLMNLLQAVWYKKAGFLASLAIRLGHYMFWHIVLGIYVEQFEMAM
jgi:hypothetical protein